MVQKKKKKPPTSKNDLLITFPRLDEKKKPKQILAY